MSVGNVWLFVFCAVLVATVVSSKQEDPGIDSGRHERQELPRKLSNHSVDTPAYQVTPKQAALNGPSNRGKFNGKWTSLKGNKRYSKTSRRMEMNFNSLPHERSKSFPVGQELFDFAVHNNIPQLAQNSIFFQGMVKNTLNKGDYTNFMLQDTLYLEHVAVLSRGLIPYFQERGQADFANFFVSRASRYERDLEGILQKYRLAGTKYVIKSNAVQMYIDFLDKVKKNNPEDVPLALLACSKLWPWMANNYYRQIDPNNKFKEWFEENRSNQPGTTEIFVNTHFQQKDPQKSRLILCEGLIMEANLFLEAGKEELLVPENFCS